MIDPAAATPADIPRAVERWARVRGFVMHSSTGYDRRWSGDGWGIHVNPLPPRGSLLIVPPGVNELMGIEWATVDDDFEPGERDDREQRETFFGRRTHGGQSTQWLDLGWAILTEARRHGVGASRWIMQDIQIDPSYRQGGQEFARVTARYAALVTGEQLTVRAAVDSLRDVPMVRILRPLDRDFGPRPSDGWGWR